MSAIRIYIFIQVTADAVTPCYVIGLGYNAVVNTNTLNSKVTQLLASGAITCITLHFSIKTRLTDRLKTAFTFQLAACVQVIKWRR